MDDDGMSADTVNLRGVHLDGVHLYAAGLDAG